MKFRNRVPVFVVCAIALAPVRAFTAQDAIVEIETRKGLTRSFALVEPPAAPVASVILFAGGDGKLRINSEGIQRGLYSGWGSSHSALRRQANSVATLEQSSVSIRFFAEYDNGSSQNP